MHRVIAERAESQPAHHVAERLREALSQAIGASPGFKELLWAASDGTIPDRSEPAVAVLDPRYAVAQEDGGPGGHERIDQLWEKSGGLRQWRNALILVAPNRFKLLQEQDPGAELTLMIDVRSSAGIGEDTITQRIVEGLDQLNITVPWEPA